MAYEDNHNISRRTRRITVSSSGMLNLDTTQWIHIILKFQALVSGLNNKTCNYRTGNA